MSSIGIVILGLILVLIGYVAPLPTLVWVGVVVAIVGAVLFFVNGRTRV